MSLNVFFIPRLWQDRQSLTDRRGYHRPWKKLDRKPADCPALASLASHLRDRTCKFCNFTTDLQFYWLKCKTHMTTLSRVPSKQIFNFLPSYPWRCRPDAGYNQSDAVYIQSSCESSSHIDGTELPSCVWVFSSLQTKWFPILVKMLMEGNERTFCVTLNNRKVTSLDEHVLDKSYWATQLTHFNLVIPTSTKFCLQFICYACRKCHW